MFKVVERKSKSFMNQYPAYSVLMSVYAKETPEYLQMSMESMFHQTVLTDDFVLVCDGPMTDGLNNVIDIMANKYGNILHVIRYQENRGLGKALADGILACKNELVARMDSDDISRGERCEIQLKEFLNNPQLSICGSHVKEFTKDISFVVSKREVMLQHDDILQFQKKRTAFNHMTVMFKKSAVLRAGNYQDVLLMEDSYLWVKMFQTGAVAMNVNDYLVYVRVDNGLYKRRGGWGYLFNCFNGRYKIYQTGFIGVGDFLMSLVAYTVLALIPEKLRIVVIRKFLRQ